MNDPRNQFRTFLENDNYLAKASPIDTQRTRDRQGLKTTIEDRSITDNNVVSAIRENNQKMYFKNKRNHSKRSK